MTRGANGTSPEEESLAARRAHACGSRKPTREPPRAGSQSPPPRKMLYNMTDGPRPDHSSDPQGDCALLVVPLQTWRGYPPLCDTRTRSGGTSRSESPQEPPRSIFRLYFPSACTDATVAVYQQPRSCPTTAAGGQKTSTRAPTGCVSDGPCGLSSSSKRAGVPLRSRFAHPCQVDTASRATARSRDNTKPHSLDAPSSIHRP